jgi:hypothetical protein
LAKRRFEMQSTPKGLKLEQVNAAREVLESLPAPPKEAKLLSVKEAVKLLVPTVRKLFQRGHTREGVLALLREQGIECSDWMLETVFREAKPKGEKKVPAAASAKHLPVVLLSALPGTAAGPTAGAPASAQVVARLPVPNGVGERKVEGSTAVADVAAAPSKAS